MNNYYEKLKEAKMQIERFLTEIFKVYGNELLLRLEEYNLLDNPNNCIETSTATGFIMEEFIVSKLETYTKDHDGEQEIKILRLNNSSTGKTSYDCYTIYQGVYIMFNIKIQKEGVSNTAVAAINILHNDYVHTNPSQEKAYLVLKTFYKFGHSKTDSQRKILITGINSYYLEELDFSSGHRQDHRNWSATFTSNSGRLQVSDYWKAKHLLSHSDIAYSTTKQFIEQIFKHL